MKTLTQIMCIAAMVAVLDLRSAASQELLIMPDASPAAMVMQEVGISKVTISYHSPAINGREVWGKLVPYGFEAATPFGNGKSTPWRAGANENTTFTLTHDAQIEGKPLRAGTYGLFMVAGPDEWTIIFSNNSTSWGHFFYEESEDALRVTVKPVSVSESQERLSYGFDNSNNTKTTAYLRWEKLKVPITITFDTPSIVVENLKKQLRNRNAFSGQALIRAANYCIQNNIALDQAAYWADRAVNNGGGNAALFTKAAVLEKQGKKPEADAMLKKAIDGANENELNAYGYALLGQKKIDAALDVFKTNTVKFPKSWNVWDSLGEVYDQKGDKKSAIENYNKALKIVTDDANKKRIGDILKKLNEGK
jgi:predicted negative regulator of RcsB-dependent stress response